MKIKKRTFHNNGWEGQKGWEITLTQNEALALYGLIGMALFEPHLNSLGNVLMNVSEKTAVAINIIESPRKWKDKPLRESLRVMEGMDKLGWA